MKKELLIFLLGVSGSASAAQFAVHPAAPVLFTSLDERSASFTADGNTVYFAVRVGDGGAMEALCVSTRKNGRWSEPEVLPFSGDDAVSDADPFITPDGKTLYFASSRSPDGKPKHDLDIWFVRRTAKGWDTPRLVLGVNSDASDRSPILAPSGTMYFTSNRGADNLYMAVRKGDGFDTPVSLGPNVNGAPYEPMLAVSPDEQTLVFSAMGRQDETLARGRPYPRGDLFVSHWTGAGWGPSIKLGPAINTNATEMSPMFSSDGRTLYFMSERGFATNQNITLDFATLTNGLKSNLNGRGNVYAIDARALDEVKP